MTEDARMKAMKQAVDILFEALGQPPLEDKKPQGVVRITLELLPDGPQRADLSEVITIPRRASDLETAQECGEWVEDRVLSILDESNNS